MAETHPLVDVLVLLAALVVFVPLFQRLKLGAVLAYLTAGVIIGPSGFGLITDVKATEPFAQLGIVLMLFTVGLELSFGRLRLFHRSVYALAIAQVVGTTLVLAVAAWRLGLEIKAALTVGGMLMLSSTAIVLQLLSDRGTLTGPVGRTSIAILLIQDLAVAPLIVFISGAGTATNDVSATLGLLALKFGLFLAAVWAFDRQALRPLLRLAASTQTSEVFMGTTLLLVLGVGWVSETIGLSMALGAFIAGMMVADTEYRHQVTADIQPVRGLLLGLFFITVGMGIDLAHVYQRAATIAALVGSVMAVKAILIAGLARAFGQPASNALTLGGLLSQMSEFSFVLLALSVQTGIVTPELGHILLAAIAISMAATPAGAALLDSLSPPHKGAKHSMLGNLKEETGQLAGHVVIAGFGQVGMAVARFLAGERVTVLVLDLTPKRVTASRVRGLRVFFGNAARIDVLRAAHLDRANALVVAVPDPVAAEQITAIAHASFPHLPIFVRASDQTWVPRMKAVGARAVVLDGLTTALELAERVMLVYAPEKEFPA
ncbi:MAG: cation:proton antiporter [Defluviicoccus sp.]